MKIPPRATAEVLTVVLLLIYLSYPKDTAPLKQ